MKWDFYIFAKTSHPGSNPQLQKYVSSKNVGNSLKREIIEFNEIFWFLDLSCSAEYTFLEMRVLWPRSKNPYGSFAKPGVLSTAWGSFASGRVIWCTRQAQRVLWRHRLIEGSLNVTPWLIYASLPVSVWFFNEHNSSCMSYFWCIIKLILYTFICNMLLNT